MDSIEAHRHSFDSLSERGTTRRKFIAETAGCTAGLALMAFPGIISEVFAARSDKTREEIIKEVQEKAEKYMQIYGACSQGSFCALNDQFDLKGDNIIPGLKLFAGGITGRGETCGAVTGSLLALGISFGAKDKKEYAMHSPSQTAGSKLFDRFSAEFSSTRCSKVVEHQYGRSYDFQNPEDMKLFMEAARTGKCNDVVKKAVMIAADIIMQDRQM